MAAFLVLLLFAIIFLVAGGVMLSFRNRTRQKSALMSQTETSSASSVAGLAPRTLVEVKGMLRCEEPLTSEFAEKTCAHYSSKVTREYRERDRQLELPDALRHRGGFADGLHGKPGGGDGHAIALKKP